MFKSHAHRTMDMTEGSLLTKVLFFSLPIMLSGILQLLFNAADTIVVGRFAGNEALAAVGSVGSLNNMIISLFVGLSIGVNVLVARFTGAKDAERVCETVHTAVLLSLVGGAVLAVVGFAAARPLLEIMGSPEDVIDLAELYIRIIFIGMPVQMLYNFCAAVLRAVGDTKRPLYFLTIAGVINAGLNLVFVIGCNMSAEGVAIASAIAQWVSAILIVIHLLRRQDACRLDMRKLRLHPMAAKRVLMIGIPSGLQNAIFAVANLFVQAGLNSFDEITVSGAAAAANADTLVFNMMGAFYTACASFVSRNWGAGHKERITKSYLISMFYAFAVGSICGGLLLVFGRQFLSLFADKPEVIDAGMDRLRIMAFSYGIGALMDASIAASRGIGKSIAPTIMVIMGSCVFRVIWIYTVFAYFHTVPSLYLLYIFSWVITGIAECIYFRAAYKKSILKAQIW